MKKKQKKDTHAVTLNIARALYYFNAILWLWIALFTFGEMILSDNSLTAAFMVSGFLLFNAVLLFMCGRMLNKRTRWIWLFALFIVLLNAFIAFFIPHENLGIIALVIDFVLLFGLLSLRKAYF
jgi:hypothetical protein